MIDLLCTINDKLFLNLRATDIQPVREEFSYVFLQQVDILLQFQSFSKLYDNSVKWVEIIAVITAIAGKMHYGQSFLLFVGTGWLIFLPIYQNGLHSTSWLSLKY